MLKKRYFKTKDECEVAFELSLDDASRVDLVCETNGWKPVEMKKQKKTGAFRTRMRFPKEGEFQFRYLVDNASWLDDEMADGYTPNGFGGRNCLLSTK